MRITLTLVAIDCCCKYWSIRSPTPWRSPRILPPLCNLPLYFSNKIVLFGKKKRILILSPKKRPSRARRTRVEFAVHLSLHSTLEINDGRSTVLVQCSMMISYACDRMHCPTLAIFSRLSRGPSPSRRRRSAPAARSETREWAPPFNLPPLCGDTATYS